MRALQNLVSLFDMRFLTVTFLGSAKVSFSLVQASPDPEL